MAEKAVNGGLEAAKQITGVQGSLVRAREYMYESGGKLRVDHGIDIWNKIEEMDREIEMGDRGLVVDIIHLMDMSKEGSDERTFFSGLASREMEILTRGEIRWNKWMVADLLNIEDLGTEKDKEIIRAIFKEKKVEIGEVLGECYEETNEIDGFVEIAFSEEMDWKSQETIRGRAKMLVSGLGLSEKMTDDFVSSWLTLRLEKIEEGGKKQKLKDTLSSNLSCLQELREKIGEDGISKLYREYGITNFGRYPSEVMIKQVENDGKSRPYGIWLGAWADWNGGFLSQGEKSLVKNIERDANGLGFDLIIVEARDKMSTVKRVVTLDRKFGKDNKIAFVIISGHGSANRIFLGEEPEDILSLPDLIKKSSSKMRKYYKEKVPFLFNSCSTGQGIGPGYSIFGNSYSMAPGSNIGSINWVNLKMDTAGDLFFDGEYGFSSEDESLSVVYKDGKEFGDGLKEENKKLYEKEYQKMLKSKKVMEGIWLERSIEYDSLMLEILKKEKLDPLKNLLRKDFGGESRVELESGIGGMNDDSLEDYHSGLSMNLGEKDHQMDWGIGFHESIGRLCRWVYALGEENRKRSWPEIRVVGKNEDGSKKIIKKYKIDMSNFWPENIL